MKGFFYLLLLAGSLLPVSQPGTAQSTGFERRLEGISFAVEPGALYLPAREIATELGWPLRWDARSQTLCLRGQTVSERHLRWSQPGWDQRLVALRGLRELGAQVGWRADRGLARVADGGREFWVRCGPKRVAINRAAQRMRAWQGERLVLDTRVSTGRPGQETPRGLFAAGPYKARMHYSSLYHHAPMPWSVQVHGNVFIHGFHEVPPRAASRGCIRVPLTGRNPARWFFEWVDVGTPIMIADEWPPAE